MGFKCGIVGLPNVGKSTLFNALTKTAAAQAANYPFCTIEPNTGDVAVPDPRLMEIGRIAKSANIVPTRLTFVDIAGLVRGASTGEGLGNQFLANIRETDAIAHVLRCFEDDDVTHVEGRVDPVADAGVALVEQATEATNRGLVVSVLRQFNMTADQAGRVTDVLSKSMRTSLLDFSSLREAMKFAGPLGVMPLPPEQNASVVNKGRTPGVALPTLDEAVEAGSWLCGTSEDVVAHFKGIEERYPGVERVNIGAVMGMPLEVFKDQLSIISEEVMPAFQG